MISRSESSLEMILLLKGLAKATAAAASKLRATRHRTASIFMIQQINTFFVSATEIRSGTRPVRTLGRGRRRRTTQRFIQFQQRPLVQRDKAAARSIDIRNYCNDDRDENWKNESLENRATAGCSRLITDQPQAATGHT